MTVESSINRSGPFIASGATGTFPRNFLVFDPAHVRVVRSRGGVETDIAAGISHSGMGAASGTVTLTQGIQSGDRITLLRNMPNVQRSDYSAQSSVPTEQVELDLDLLAMQVQDMAERQRRALTLPVDSTQSGEEAMRAALAAPAYALEAKRAAEEAKMSSLPDPATVDIRLFSAATAAGADHTAAFQSAINALPLAGGEIRLGEGNYTVDVSKLDPGAKNILWTGPARVNGSEVWPLPGRRDSYSPTLGRRMFQDVSTDTVFTRKDNRRSATYSGGASGVLTFLERWQTDIGPNVGGPGAFRAEKAGVFGVKNESDYANGIGLMVQAIANGQGAVWSLESNTYSNVVPMTRAHRSAEFNIQAKGQDINELRWIVDIVSHGESVTSRDPNASIYTGLMVGVGSADMHYGAVFKDHNTNGSKFRNAAIRVDSDADVMQAWGKTTSGKIKLGSREASGVVAEYLGQGRNAAGQATNYSDIRTLASTSTTGAEQGTLQLQVAVAGSLTTAIQATGTSSNSVSIRVGGNLKVVSEGAADSGGSGFRTLRVPN